MVVAYPTASEGSAASFFIVTPQVLCKWKGSIIPKVLPQVAVAVGLAVVARFWNPIADRDEHVSLQSGMSTLGILLSFLLVFKTQTAYGQFWEACTESHRMIQTSRLMAMTASTYFPFDTGPQAPTSVAPAAGVDEVHVDLSRGPSLRVRVIAARGLYDQDKADEKLHVIVRVGDQSFKTHRATSSSSPVWNSEVFEFALKKESAITFVMRGSDDRDSGLGWVHVQSGNLRKDRDSRWQKLTYRLEGSPDGELEVELCLTRGHDGQEAAPVPAPNQAIAAGGKGAELPPLQPTTQREDALRLLSSGCSTPSTASGTGVRVTHELLEEEEDRFDNESLPVEVFLRRIIRLIALHFFVVAEYFRRTGQNAIRAKKDQDAMRQQIKSISSSREYAMLYPDSDPHAPGSQAANASANPTIVLYWLQLTIGRCGAVHNIPAPILASFIPQIASLTDDFGELDKIDKFQFPLPYTQVVKILCIIFMFVLSPWVLQPQCGDMTELIIGLAALGFFGLDEVAEILESPFGNDPNHLDLWSYGEELLDDLELMYYGRSRQLDVVFKEAGQGLFDRVERVHRTSSQRPSVSLKAKEVFAKGGAATTVRGL